jgi:hypothetical protein
MRATLDKDKEAAGLGDRSAEEASNPALNADDGVTAGEVAMSTTVGESGKTRRYWLTYTGPEGTSLSDPNTGRLWRAGEELEVTKEEGDRLTREWPRDVKVRTTSEKIG